MPPSKAEYAAKCARVLELAAAGQPTAAIARQLGMDRRYVRRIRNEAGHRADPKPEMQPLTVEQKWATNTRPVDGGHLEWAGERGKQSGSPVMRYRGKSCSPTHIAFKIRAGRDAEGQAFAECDYRHCVAPDHVTDTRERNERRSQTRDPNLDRYLPERCGRGHDQNQHRRFYPDGHPYCGECSRVIKAANRSGETAPASAFAARTPEELFHLHAREADGGHMTWIGPMLRTTPIVAAVAEHTTAYRIAFRIRTGRDPVGIAKPGCDMPGCVAPAHIDDRPIRERDRAALAAILALGGAA